MYKQTLLRSSRTHLSVLLLFLAVCIPNVATAEDAPAVAPTTIADNSRYTLTVGGRAWISQGKTGFNIGGLNGRPNVASELSWKGLNSPIASLTADLVIREVPVLRRVVVNINGGYSSLNSGTLRDQDWLLNNRTFQFSETLSPVTGMYAAFASIDAGWRPLEWRFPDNPLPGGLDLLLGYQFWQEQYEATGFKGQFLDFPVQSQDLAITETHTWNSFRMGGRLAIPCSAYVTLRGSAFFIPWTHFQSEDIHHLRTDLAQNPSFVAKATGGQGVQLEGSMLVGTWRGLFLEAGYIYWDIRSGSGTNQAFGAQGQTVTGPFNQENTKRQGVFFGVNYLF